MRRLALLLAVIAAAALAGCQRGATTALSGSVVSLRVADYRYDRQSVSIAGPRITFAVSNDGTEPTNFRVRRAADERRVPRTLVSIATLEPGEAGAATADLRPGDYVMYSSVGRNETLGEYGSLTVTRR